MNAVGRQDDGSAGRQKQDAPSALRGFDLAGEFLAANLASHALPSFTLEAVKAARSSAELSRQGGQSILLYRGRPLGGEPDEDDLRRLTATDADSVFVVFGLGLGHTARALRALTDAPIVVFEPDAGVLRSVLELGPSDLRTFELVCTTHDLSQIWPLFSSGRRSAVLVSSRGYVEQFAEAAADLRATLAQLVQRGRVNDATHRLRAREWISDLLANVELLCEHPGFLALAGKYRGVPAFIVGAGPSLGKNGALLLQAQKKGLVFAVNSSARALAHHGAEPQVLACMESIDVSHLFEGIGFMDRVVRAFSLTAHPRALRTGKGPMLPLYEGLPQISHPLSQLTGQPGLPVSGSVSTLAFSLAQRLGCSPIVFVGQDLAYTGGRAYAPGTAYEESRVEASADGRELELNWSETLKQTHNVGGRKIHEREPLTETTAWGGDGKVWTGITFSAVRAWLESAAVVLGRDAPETRLVNATEGGARIAGFEELTLAELLGGLPDRDITPESLLRDALEAQPPIARDVLARWADAQADGVNACRRAARRVQRLAGLAERSARGADLEITKRFARLEQAERGLSQAVAAAPLLDAWSWAAVDALMERNAAEQQHDPKASAERALAFETLLGSTIDRAAHELETELRKLSQRLRAQPTAR